MIFQERIQKRDIVLVPDVLFPFSLIRGVKLKLDAPKSQDSKIFQNTFEKEILFVIFQNHKINWTN